MINIYNRFIPNCATILNPLYSMLKPSKKGQSIMLTWTDGTRQVFCIATQALTSATTLSYPTPDAVTEASTDASDTGIGAVLQQLLGDTWKPISFFSKNLSPDETRYNAIDRELLAIYKAVKHFRYLLEGRQFHYKPISHSIHSNGGMSDEVDQRIAKSKKAWGALEVLWSKRDISTEAKVQMFEGIIESSLLYGCEVWSI